ncbi:MAG: hypothetical protein GQ535_11155 [Rhodobacteraceae bacterium]|nr:hypothetical protein [Paracoccaceae bacterium]
MATNNSEWSKHVHAVRKASTASHKTRTVLLYLCFMADYAAPHHVTTTKEQIGEETGVTDLRHVQKMLQALKKAGTISVARNGQGGRSIPVTYALHAVNHHKPQPTPQQGNQITIEEFNAAMSEGGSYGAATKILNARHPNGWTIKR